jgi:hypothetical protein
VICLGCSALISTRFSTPQWKSDEIPKKEKGKTNYRFFDPNGTIRFFLLYYETSASCCGSTMKKPSG